MGYYVHEIPGRLRAKIPKLKQNHRHARTLESMLELQSGILSVSVSTTTGSVLVFYDPETIRSQRILVILMEAGYIDLSRLLTSRTKPGMNVGETLLRTAFGLALEIMVQRTVFSFYDVLAQQFQAKTVVETWFSALVTLFPRR